jgi:eukaryotic-like serine/threonine-protein kinase
LLVMAVILVAGLVVFTIAKINGGGSDVKRAAIPSVEGQQLKQALTQLSAAGFTNVDHSKTTTSEDVPAGAVATQDPPAAQTVPVTDKITLVISTGPDAVSVPNVKGLDQNTANAQLQNAGLQIGDTTEQDGNFEKGTVIKTDPAVGSKVAKGSKVNLFIATGQVSLGDLRNQTQDKAVAAIQKLGLTAVVQTRPADPGEAVGVVVEQDPGKGKVDVGSSVKITVTTQPESTPTPTPTPTDVGSPSPSPSPTA